MSLNMVDSRVFFRTIIHNGQSVNEKSLIINSKLYMIIPNVLKLFNKNSNSTRSHLLSVSKEKKKEIALK